MNEGEVARHEAGIAGEVICKGHQVACRAADVGHDVGNLQPLLRKLRADLEGSDRVYLITEKVDAEGKFGGIGIDIEDTAAHGIFARLIHIVFALEAEGEEVVGNLREVVAFAHFEREGALCHALRRRDALCQGGGEGDNI